MRAAVVAVAAALALTSVATAATLTGSPRADLLVTTGAADSIDARGGADRIVSWGDLQADDVRCGSGADVANADPADRVDGSCETVLRQASRDLTTAPAAQHETQVEPSAAADGDTVVTVFQSGRYRDGGAAAIGFATSVDGGRSWTSGTLPGLPGGYEVVSDPVVARDTAHGVWLATSLAVGDRLAELVVSRSANGLVWEQPLVAVSEPGEELSLDKEWIACDNWPASPRLGTCYLAYTELTFRAIGLRSSSDGGRTWSAPVYGPPAGEGVVGAFPVVRPNGDLVVPYLDLDGGVAVLRSADGARTVRRVFEYPGVQSDPALRRIRTIELPSAAVTPEGRVLVVWQDCSLRASCDGNDLVLAVSDDGLGWSAATRLPTRAAGSAFIPALGVDPLTGRAAVTFYAATGCPNACRIDAWLVLSQAAGRWSPPRRLTARSLALEWIAETRSGRMLADYVALPWSRGRPIPVLVLAEPPVGSDRLRQAVFVSERLAGAGQRAVARR